jgi:hypothetical protein
VQEALRAAGNARPAPSRDASLALSDDTAPQLLSGFGASSWQRNVAFVQSSPATFAELRLAEPDCSGFAARSAPDLSHPMYSVDPTVVALLDTLARTQQERGAES